MRKLIMVGVLLISVITTSYAPPQDGRINFEYDTELEEIRQNLEEAKKDLRDAELALANKN